MFVQDVHERFRTESHAEPTGRFNERFLLSLASCKACIVMDDELNVLPISSHMKSITPVPVKEVILSSLLISHSSILLSQYLYITTFISSLLVIKGLRRSIRGRARPEESKRRTC